MTKTNTVLAILFTVLAVTFKLISLYSKSSGYSFFFNDAYFQQVNHTFLYLQVYENSTLIREIENLCSVAQSIIMCILHTWTLFVYHYTKDNIRLKFISFFHCRQIKRCCTSSYNSAFHTVTYTITLTSIYLTQQLLKY